MAVLSPIYMVYFPHYLLFYFVCNYLMEYKLANFLPHCHCIGVLGVDKNKGPLNWDAWMKIALGAARGLAYLHEDSNPCVIVSQKKKKSLCNTT